MKVYVKPTCTTCRKVIKTLRERGADFERIDYFETPLTRKKISELIDRLDVQPAELIRTRERLYRELDLKGRDLSKKQVTDLLYEYPELLQRPVVEIGDKAYLVRPASKIEEIL